MNCKQAAHLISAEQDQPLRKRARLSLALHLLVCHYCRDFRQQLALLRRVARHPSGTRRDD